MNYDEFRSWRTELLRERSPRRLDCMNPEVALAHLRPTSLALRAASRKETLDRWRSRVGVTVSSDRLVVGSGIRPLLDGVFAALGATIETLWLPEDVYPVYWKLSSNLRRRGFPTLPDVDWSVLEISGPRDALLLPHPLSPAGRSLSDAEQRRLIEWLAAHPERRLIFDCAYAFEHRELEARLRSEQTISIWSLSKPWLSRGTLGLARVPATMREPLQSRVPAPEPSQLARASALLESAPMLPATLAERFAGAWARLTPTLRAACPSWRPPESGYFSILPLPYAELLAQHNLLAVPATVFGAKTDRLSIATCLYDIELHDGIRAR